MSYEYKVGQKVQYWRSESKKSPMDKLYPLVYYYSCNYFKLDANNLLTLKTHNDNKVILHKKLKKLEHSYVKDYYTDPIEVDLNRITPYFETELERVLYL